MIFMKIDIKEALEMKKFYIHYLNRRKEIMKKNQFKVECMFGDIINKDNISQHQIIKLNYFSAKRILI